MKLLLVAAALAVAPTPKINVNSGTNITTAFDFLKTNVMERRLVKEQSTSLIDHGRIQAVHKSLTVYSNLMRTDTGLKYNTLSSATQINYKMENGQPVLPGENKDRMSVSECQVSEAKSVPGRLVGFCMGIASTSGSSLGGGTTITLELKENTLIMSFKPNHFYEYYADTPSGRKPVMSNGTTEFSINSGKLKSHSIYSAVDLNPENLEPIPGTESSNTVTLQEQ